VPTLWKELAAAKNTTASDPKRRMVAVRHRNGSCLAVDSPELSTIRCVIVSHDIKPAACDLGTTSTAGNVMAST